MDIPRLLQLQEYWAENPPVHLLVKGFMGYKAPRKAVVNNNTNNNSEKENEENLGALMRNVPIDVHQSNRPKVRMI